MIAIVEGRWSVSSAGFEMLKECTDVGRVLPHLDNGMVRTGVLYSGSYMVRTRTEPWFEPRMFEISTHGSFLVPRPALASNLVRTM